MTQTPSRARISPSSRTTRTPLAAPSEPAVPAPSGSFKRVLGVPSLVLLGLVYMVPLTVFTTYGIVTEITGGRQSAAYLLTLAVMLFTARSYGKMARAYPSAGSAYAYSTASFGPVAGFLTGWSLMLDYLLLPMINYLIVGIYLNAAIPMIPAWVFVLASIALVSGLNLAGITTIARTNWIIVVLQGVFIVVFAVLAAAAVGGQGAVDLAAPFTGAQDASTDTLGLAPLMTGAAILCLSFLGFDAVSTFAEEAKDASRTVPRAIMLTTIIAGVMFVGVSMIGQLVMPVAGFDDPDAAAFEIVLRAGGQFLSVFFVAASVAGSLGSALTSQASVSRILYSMGRDGVLPRSVFGRLSARRSVPVGGVLVTSAVALLALVLSLATVSSLISFGALVAFSVVNLTVVKRYWFGGTARGLRHAFSTLILPAVGFLATVWLWTSLSAEALIVGIAWAVLGVVALAFVTRGFRRPVPTLDA